jgi:hypothetical protein
VQDISPKVSAAPQERYSSCSTAVRPSSNQLSELTNSVSSPSRSQLPVLAVRASSLTQPSQLPTQVRCLSPLSESVVRCSCPRQLSELFAQASNPTRNLNPRPVSGDQVTYLRQPVELATLVYCLDQPFTVAAHTGRQNLSSESSIRVSRLSQSSVVVVQVGCPSEPSESVAQVAHLSQLSDRYRY